jgi:hypothetical protein
VKHGAAHARRSRESKGFHVKSQTVRFVWTKSSLCGFVPGQKLRRELSSGRGRQPGSSRKGGVAVARRQSCGGYHDAAWQVRQGPHASEAPRAVFRSLSVGWATLHGGHAGCVVGSPEEQGGRT